MMSRRKRKFKKHWKLKKHVYWRVGLIVVLLVVAIWVAEFTMQKEVEHEAVVKGLTGTEEERYQHALEKASAGEMEEARVIMGRLARLGDTAERPLGFGKAHLWVAQDALSGFKSDFIWRFPMRGLEEVKRASLGNGKDIVLAQRHLEHAIALSPELGKAPELLAATLAAQGKRNQAVEVLLAAVSHEAHPHPSLHIPLANLSAMKANKDDDLLLRERMLYIFSTLGQRVSSGREKSVSLRVRYVLSALELHKYENAEIALKRLEVEKSDDEQARQVSALRMAYHYHRAIHRVEKLKSSSSGDFKEVVDDLAAVVRIQPDCQSALDALSLIAQQDPSQKLRIQQILKDVLQEKSTINPSIKSRVSSSLALMAGAKDESRRRYLEKALEENPNNAEALLRLLEFKASEARPDYIQIEKLATKALAYSSSAQQTECYALLGLAKLRLKKWNDAIVALEKALPETQDKVKTHRLLAEAYRAVGKPKIAKAHEELGKTNP